MFFSCLALGAFGVGISLVLGLQEIVMALRRMIEAAAPDKVEPVQPVSRRSYVAILGTVLVLLIVTVVAFNAINHRIEAGRLKVFKLIARDQMRQLGPHLEREIAKVPAPCPTCAPASLPELIEALNGQSFCQTSILFMADPSDPAVLWRYPSGYSLRGTGDDAPKFERFFIADDIDRAVAQALSGDTAWIDQMNGAPDFNWYQVIRDGQGKIRAVLKVFGNPKESYRDYQAVAKAAAKRKA